MEPQRPEDPPGREGGGLTKTEIRWIAGGVLAIIFGIFIAQNAREVRIDFVFFHAEVRLIWLFLICAALGAIIDRLLQRRGVLPQTRRRSERKLKREERGPGPQ
jgi:uncharacterized integral membrane protein